MDRATVFPLQLPLETDLLRAGQFAMVGIAAMAETVLGSATVADGFAIAPTAPASLSVVIGPGRVYQRAQLESTPWSSLPVDFRPILKQGIALDSQTIPLSPPATVNYAVNYLIQVSYSDKDDDAQVRPFYNAANPSQPYAGPGNNGVASPQSRKGIAQILTKAGPAAPVGAQTTPDPDPGFIGLYVVTVANGTVGITSGNIATYNGAPFVIAKLPDVPKNVQANTWTSFFDTSATPNLIIGSPIPALKAYAAPTSLRVVVGNTNTGPVKLNVSGLGLQDLTRRNATPLLPGDIVAGQVITITHDGLRWRLDSLAQGEVPRVVASPILWVRTDGSDLNDGSANTPTKAFATIGAALAFGTSQIAYAGTQLQIILGIRGTYAAPQTAGSIGGLQTLLGGVGSVLIMSEEHRLGDLTQQDNYTIQGSGFVNNSGIIHPSFGTYLVLQGVTIQNNSAAFNTLTASSNAIVYCQYVTFGGLPGGSGAAHFFIPDGGQIRIGPGCKITNSMGSLIHTNGGGFTISGTIKFIGTINFVTTAWSETAGRIVIATATPFDISAATVTGQRYLATMNGVINSLGQGANAFPGNAAGTFANGGVYV